jgi:hypothetical protein
MGCPFEQRASMPRQPGQARVDTACEDAAPRCNVPSLCCATHALRWLETCAGPTRACIAGQAVVCTVAQPAQALGRFVRKDACRSRAAAAEACATHPDIVAMQHNAKASLRAPEQPTQLYSVNHSRTPAVQAADCTSSTGITGTQDTQRSVSG